MRKLTVFNHVTLDGYFADAHGDMSWAHSDDAESNAFAAENAKGGGALLFGRITYELMAGFWPTPRAHQIASAVAEGMNAMQKIVFSTTLPEVSWSNTTLLRGNLAAEVRALKQEPGPGIAILGSGTLVSQLSDERLIDEYQVVVHPIVLGQGKSMFAGVKSRLMLKRTSTRSFGNGNILLCYEPAG